jgi:hypothetical protein
MPQNLDPNKAQAGIPAPAGAVTCVQQAGAIRAR